MHSGSFLEQPAFAVALALAIGMAAQVLARHLRLPGIVVLLASGAALGPDGLGWIRPHSLGTALQTLVGYAVAVILFEGGLQLNIRHLRRQANPIRGLVTVGSLVTAIGGTAAAYWIMGWPLPIAALFGSLVIVTGPTVITPLLRRLRVESKTATVLEAEGVFGDAIGALVAVVTLEVVLTPQRAAVGHWAWELVGRLGLGAVIGLAAGAVIAVLLRYERLIPRGLDNVATLSLVLLLYQSSNALLEESGIVAVIAAGIAIGNTRAPLVEELKEFKEQLTVMLIGLLFVLLAADVRFADLEALGVPALLTVAALIILVRPLNVLAGTAGSELTVRHKTFLACMAPRGIVAAAVASLFAQRLHAAEMPLGMELRALVFLVIAATVTIYGLLGGPLATLLGLKRGPQGGYAILGANPLARTLALVLQDSGQPVVLIDSNPEACRVAERAGLKVLFGSGLAEGVLQRAALEERRGAVALTPNDSINYSFAHRARREFRCPRVWVALGSDRSEVRPSMLERIDAARLFGQVFDVSAWNHRVEHGRALLQTWEPREGKNSTTALELSPDSALALVWKGRERSQPFSGPEAPYRRPSLVVLAAERNANQVEDLLTGAGWNMVSSQAVDPRPLRDSGVAE